MDRIDKVNLIRLIVVAGFVSSVFFHYIAGVYLGHGYPYSTFLYMPDERFHDFTVAFDSSKNLNPYSNKFSVYFPFTYVLIFLFTVFNWVLAYIILFGGFLVFLITALWRHLQSTEVVDRILAVFTLVIISYPVLFAFERGNFELIVFIFLGCFVFLYQNNRDNLAVILLACAIAMKVYPAVFAILFVIDRKWTQLIQTACCAALFTALSAALLEGGISSSIYGVQRALLFFEANFINSVHGLQHNSSIYVPIYLSFIESGTSRYIAKYYPLLAVIIFLCAFLYLKLTVNAFWKKIAILSFLIILLPQVSYDYKLIYVYLPLILFLGEIKQSKYDALYAVIFGLLLIPKDYYYFNYFISINGLINACLMLIFIVVLTFDKDRKIDANL